MIDTSGWKEFRVGDVFECKTTKPYIFDDVIDGETPYITRTAENNGCDAYIAMDPEYLNKGQCITIGAEGMYAFYQPEDFIAGVKVYTLRNKHMTEKSGLMVCTILNQEIYKYSYGRARILDKVKNEIIKLPATPSGEPDWQYMEDFMRGGHCEPITTSVKSSHLPLETEKWGEFRIGDLFEVGRGQRLIADDRTAGLIPYFSASDSNNGLTDMIANPLFVESDALIYSTFGDCYYVEGVFTASDEISILKNESMNKWSGLFIATIITASKYKFQFGRKAFQNKFINEKICLPQTSSGAPDWEWMENYMKSLPYSDKIGEVSQ